MSAIKILEDGITSGNWDMVCEAYLQLTGQAISVKNNQSIVLNRKNMVDVINQLFDKIDNKKNTPNTTKESKTENLENKANKLSHFGNQSQFITNEDEVSEKEKEDNKRAAAIAKQRKQYRPPPKKYKIICSSCQQEFESDIKDGDIGQQCKQCICGKIKNAR